MRPATNQYFSPARFGRLFARHTAEYLPGYLMMAAVGGGAMLLILGFITFIQKSAPSLSVQTIFFILFLLIGGSVFASTVFSQFGERRRATVALLLPASHLEKYLVAWLYAVPLFLLLFVPLFYLVTAAVVHVGAAPGQVPELLNLWQNRQDMVGIFWFFTLLGALGLWGSIYFEKAQFIKTAFGVFVLLGMLSAINFQVVKGLISPNLRYGPPFAGLSLVEGGQQYGLALADDQLPWLSVLPLALAALLWVGTYFCLTEKQL